MEALHSEGITQVVEAYLVNTLSLQGYKLIGMYQEMYPETVNCSVPHPNPSYANETAYKQELGTQTRTFFIMTLDEESSLAQINHECEKQKQNVSLAEAAQREAETQLKSATSERDRARSEAENLRLKLESKREQCNNMSITKLKMEDDLGKIREAIGSRQMDEILNGN